MFEHAPPSSVLSRKYQLGLDTAVISFLDDSAERVRRVDLPKVKKESPILKLIAKYKDPATKETEEDPFAFAKELKNSSLSM